jgi:hypothetical protein
MESFKLPVDLPPGLVREEYVEKLRDVNAALLTDILHGPRSAEYE